ncbi:hypothetical protein FB45DRAFT_870643 [Roridomyces roridus]|uniref:Uncharacterized protein n=1 Tax=Roridomyces roridus TaxID=1738132 RepID=A0AAD7BJA8_9AGAR|nr:hypothetical protein FB45DRAFT_870643 [Roridomyces roridus]
MPPKRTIHQAQINFDGSDADSDDEEHIPSKGRMLQESVELRRGGTVRHRSTFIPVLQSPQKRRTQSYGLLDPDDLGSFQNGANDTLEAEMLGVESASDSGEEDEPRALRDSGRAGPKSPGLGWALAGLGLTFPEPEPEPASSPAQASSPGSSLGLVQVFFFY